MANEIQRLKQEIALNNVIIFVGASVSVYTTNSEQETACYKGLLKDGLKQCHQWGWIDDEMLKNFFDKLKDEMTNSDGYLTIADQIKYFFSVSTNMQNDYLYKVWLQDAIGKLSAKKTELIKSIGELGCPILTTNYDLLLEDVLQKESLTLHQYVSNQIENSLDNLNDYILHVYGHFKEPDNMIFTSDDYGELYIRKLNLSKLKALFETRTLLLIGFEPGTSDPNLSTLLNWISYLTKNKSLSIYKLVSSNENNTFSQMGDVSLLDNMKEIKYGNTSEDLVHFAKNLKSFTPLIRESLSFNNQKEYVRKKYLNYLINEYGHVSIFGHANSNINLPLESVYVELKFDPTHPSIRAMKMIETHEEFKRKLLSSKFFTSKERQKLNQAIIEKNAYNSTTLYRDFMVDQWLSILLSNKTIFTETEATTIKNKVNALKENILEKNSFKDAKQYRIQEVYSKFKHFLILGHPGSGKTTLSKWLVINMAKQCLNEENLLFENNAILRYKLPVLIPIWKYVDQLKDNQNQRKKCLLQFLYENSTLNSTLFTKEEHNQLSFIIREELIQGNVLVIFEGLDEVPVHIDRSDLMKEINALLERGIDYDSVNDKLTNSSYEQKEINNTDYPDIGNRFIITSRIEGNYFDEINFYIPRLTIEDMSNDSLKLFCSSYMKSIKSDKNVTKDYDIDQLYNHIIQNKDIFHLAINPQLASVIAAVYNHYESKLPEKRIDLYEKAIETMIERLVKPSINSSTNYIGQELGLNATILWSILQDIAEYLHSKVEGLSENILKEIIRNCLINYHKQLSNDLQIDLDDFITKLVDIFKYQAGLLNEFGHNRFRFIHRTFQEYLAAKSIIYSYGIKRSENVIFENIHKKIDNPNWRVPLSMTFGLLSKFAQENELFSNIIRKLLNDEDNSLNRKASTLLIPFVLIDSLNDIYFSSNETENELIQRLSDMLLFDYQNMSGFSRLKDHQQLIHSYFSKLKMKYEHKMVDWFIEKMNNDNTVAACANIMYQLKWYNSTFHEIFLKNLHNDSIYWNWPIDSILRFYSNSIPDDDVLSKLNLKTAIYKDPMIKNYIMDNNRTWLCLVIALYGGHKNYKVHEIILEYYEIAQYLGLSNNQRAPFSFYYQEVWDRDDPCYSMAVHLDTTVKKDRWSEMPIFDTNDIYKESSLTNKILEYLFEKKSTVDLIEELRCMNALTMNAKSDILIVLTALGDFDFLSNTLKEENEAFIKIFSNRIEQLICTLKDPIARWSSHILKCLSSMYNAGKFNQRTSKLSFSNYLTIYLSLIANSGGLPVNTKPLAKLIRNDDDEDSIYAEYLSYNLTGASDDVRYSIAKLLDDEIFLRKPEQIIKLFLKLTDAVQLYRPIRTYPWPMDKFNFKFDDSNDIPIGFVNCLENMNINLPYIIDTISSDFFKQGYFTKNPELIPLVVLLNFGTVSNDSDRIGIYKILLPELDEQIDKKRFLLKKIQLMKNSYYKSRALYQLAEFYDQESYELLNESFMLAKTIPNSTLKFQVLEKIFNTTHYKTLEQTSFIQQVIEGLCSTVEQIENLHDRIIASIRLSFYGSRRFRKKYLTYAIEILSQMNENHDKIRLIIKLKSLISIYDDLEIKLNQIIQSLENKFNIYFIKSYYGKILSNEQIDIRSSISILNGITDNAYKSINDTPLDIQTYNEFDSLFLLFAQLNDVKFLLNKSENIDQLWINLFKDIDNPSNIEKILNIALRNEIFLTPQITIIIDELIEQGKCDKISILFPYIIKPSNEVLPTVLRWFTQSNNILIKNLSALLLTEAKRLFESSVDLIVNLITNDNDQMRYRAQRIFQHPDRDVQQASKRISVIGEKTLIRISEKLLVKRQYPRVRAYISSFFYDLLWDDAQIYQHLYKTMYHLEQINSSNGKRIRLFNRMHFVDSHTWNVVLRTLKSSLDPLYAEQLLYSVMTLTQTDQITPENWAEFVRILSFIDSSKFQEQIFFTETDIERIEMIIHNISVSNNINDESYSEFLESKLKTDLSIKMDRIILSSYNRIKQIGRCNFYLSDDANQTILNRISNLHLNVNLMEILIKWLIKNLIDFKGHDDSWFSMMMCDCMLALVSACVQKEDYLYRKITNSPKFNKRQMTLLLERILNTHPFFAARGNAFILISAMDQPNSKVIINAMNTLLDENVVKKYSMIGIPLIHLSPNEFIDDLLESLKSESAIKAYEILKIFTEFALNEKIDSNSKSKIIDYLVNEIGQLKSKKVVNYYYTDIKIPFTTTLENELYKAWIKIQGLSGKTQYSTGIEKP